MKFKSCSNCKFLDTICKILSIESILEYRSFLKKTKAFKDLDDYIEKLNQLTAEHCKCYEYNTESGLQEKRAGESEEAAYE